MNAERSSLHSAPDPTDHESWEGIVRRLIAHARRLGASLQDSQDVVQDALVRVVREPSWYDPQRGDLLGLLYATVRNRLRDAHRHDAVRSRAEPKLRLVEPADTALDHVTSREAARARQALLQLLSRDERQVFFAWLQQRQGLLDGRGAAAHVAMSLPAYEAAKKRLRRRCFSLLSELDLRTDDLYDGGTP